MLISSGLSRRNKYSDLTCAGRSVPDTDSCKSGGLTWFDNVLPGLGMPVIVTLLEVLPKNGSVEALGSVDVDLTFLLAFSSAC